mmetsp:Transcript_11100/g.25696  ORF Transcript_11100/g.25696 Transcript_11100/m.25696 type:complete len:236 (+) Transcript_11100:1201-1908(+)
MLVHRVRALEKRLKVVPADGKRDGRADRRPRRVATTDPVPEPEHVVRVDAECGDGRVVGGKRRKVTSDGRRLLELLEQPRLGGACVCHRLLRGKSLRGDEEERRLGVDDAEHLRDVRRVDVRHKVHVEVAFAIRLERLGHHHRTEVRAADPEVDDVRDGFARVPLPLARAHALDESFHLAEHRVHLGHHVGAVDKDRRVRAVSQRDVQHGTLLSEIDLLAREHALRLVGHLCLRH